MAPKRDPYLKLNSFIIYSTTFIQTLHIDNLRAGMIDLYLLRLLILAWFTSYKLSKVIPLKIVNGPFSTQFILRCWYYLLNTATKWQDHSVNTIWSSEQTMTE